MPSYRCKQVTEDFKCCKVDFCDSHEYDLICLCVGVFSLVMINLMGCVQGCVIYAENQCGLDVLASGPFDDFC